MHRGLPYTREKVSIRDASWGCPLSSTATASFSCRELHVTMGLHAMTCRLLNTKDLNRKMIRTDPFKLYRYVLYFPLIDLEFRWITKVFSWILDNKWIFYEFWKFKPSLNYFQNWKRIKIRIPRHRPNLAWRPSLQGEAACLGLVDQLARGPAKTTRWPGWVWPNGHRLAQLG
jgi:hypothetical protein